MSPGTRRRGTDAYADLRRLGVTADCRHATFKGVQSKLAYLEQLGVKAIWLSPVLKNARPDRQYNYHGYGQQDLLNVEERFASDGTRATAELELAELIDEAHAREIYVVLDIVLNHAARVFDYVLPSGVVSSFGDPNVLNGALGSEPPVRWVNGLGFPRADWQDRLDPPGHSIPTMRCGPPNCRTTCSSAVAVRS